MNEESDLWASGCRGGLTVQILLTEDQKNPQGLGSSPQAGKSARPIALYFL